MTSQYIITEDDFKELGVFFQRIIDGDNPGLIQVHAWQNRIRSRPYNPQAEREYQCGDTCKGECSGEVTGEIFCPEEIRKDEREKMLDVVLKKLLKLTTQTSPTQSRFVWVPVIEIAIEELRKGGE